MSQYVRVELKLELLAGLIRDGKLCVADLHCLDKLSKQQVWQLCLFECTKGQCDEGDSDPKMAQGTKPKLEIPSSMIN